MSKAPASICEGRTYPTGRIVASDEPRLYKLIRRTTEYLNGVTIPRQAINEEVVRFVGSIPGDVVEVGGSGIALQPPNGEHIVLDVCDSPRNTITANAERMPFLSNSVHGFLCVSVLEHTLNPKSILSEIWRCLSPGGHVFLSVPWLFEAHMLPHDFYRFSACLLHHLTREFEIIYMRSTNSYLGCLAHFIQACSWMRALGVCLFWLDLLREPNFTWAIQINVLLRKSLTHDSGDEMVPRWPDNLRCPYCAVNGKGQLEKGTRHFDCVDCRRIYSFRDGVRPVFEEAVV